MGMGIYRKGEGLWSRGACSAVLFGIGLIGCRRLAELLATSEWGRKVLLPVPPPSGLTAAWAVAGALLAACAAGLWMLMNHAKSVDFLVDMEAELRRVSWPVDAAQSRFTERYRELIQSSSIVIASIVALTAAMFVFDYALGHGVALVLGVQL